MKGHTITALNALNRRFYAQRHESFDRTRRRPWPGWTRLLALDGFPARPRVLDVGCGNGRFLAFLVEAGVRPRSYHGIDFCAPLLDLARSRWSGTGEPRGEVRAAASPGDPVPPVVSFELRDVLAEPFDPDPDRPGGAGSFDLVVLFGVLHHVPGEDTRRRLLEQWAGRVAPGGLLVVTYWRFLRSERLRRHRVGWADAGGLEVDPADLDPGDCLLTFGTSPDAACSSDSGPNIGAPGPFRFCHDCDEEEQERLTATLSLSRLACYESDGSLNRLNQYVVMRRDH